MNEQELEQNPNAAAEVIDGEEPAPKSSPKILFARGWVLFRNRRRAVQYAGKTYAQPHNYDRQACAWFKDEEVRAEIKRLEAEIEKNVIMTASELDAYAEMLTRANPADAVGDDGEIVDLNQMSRDLAYAVKEHKTETFYDKDGNKTVRRTVKFADKTDAIQLLMKRKKMLVEEVSVKGALAVEHTGAVEAAKLAAKTALMAARKAKAAKDAR